MDIDHTYDPDFLVRLTSGVTVVLEIKASRTTRTKPSTQRRGDG
jgi:hypothetical protein